VNNNYRIYHGDGLLLLAKGVLATARGLEVEAV